MNRRTKKQPRKSAPRSSYAGLSAISEADTIDINYILMGKRDLNSVLADLEKMLYADRETDEDNFQLSILSLLFNLCGVASSVVQLNLSRLEQSIEAVFGDLYKNRKLLKPATELPLFGQNHSAYKKLFIRLEEFWESLLSNRTNLVVDSKLLGYLFEALALFCSNRIRLIRTISAEIVNSLTTAIIESKVIMEGDEKGRLAKKFLYDLYHKILKVRLRDVDLNIRLRFLHCLTVILGGLSNEFLTVGELEEVFMSLLKNKDPDDRRIVLYNLQKLYQKTTLELKTPLVVFGKQLIEHLVNEIYNEKKVSFEAVHLINTLMSFSEIIDIHRVGDLYHRIVQAKHSRALEQYAGYILYKSLFPAYRVRSTDETLASLKDRQFITAFIELEGSFTRDERYIVYMTAIACHKYRFDIDELFLMAIEYKLDTGLSMTEHQLNNSLTLLAAYVRFISNYHEKEAYKTAGYRQNILSIFNKRICMYSREIFLERLEKYPHFVWDYIRLYSLMDPSLPPSFEKYMHMISNQLAIKFEATPSVRLMREIVLYFKKMQKDKIGMLVDTIDLQKAVTVGIEVDMQRCVCLIEQFYIPALANIQCLEELISCFERVPNCRESILTMMNYNHQWIFRDFMTTVNEEQLKLYMPYRDLFFRFMEVQLGNSSIEDEHRAMLFTMACMTYRSTLPNHLQQHVPCEVRYDLVVKLLEMLLKASQIDSYGSIRQGLEEAAVKKTLNLNFTGLLLSVCKVSIQFATNSNLVDLLTELMLNKYAPQYESVLHDLVLEEVMFGQNNPFVFWRLFRSILLRCEEGQRATLIDIMIGFYFSKQFKKQAVPLLNKLILFLVELTDQAFTDRNYPLFSILQLLFKKTSRRYGRTTLSKIAVIFQNKLSAQNEYFIKNPQVKSMKEILVKRSNAAVSTAKKRARKPDEESDNKSSNSTDKYSSGSESGQSKSSNGSKMEVEDEQGSSSRGRSASNKRSTGKGNRSNSNDKSSSNRRDDSRARRRAK